MDDVTMALLRAVSGLVRILKDVAHLPLEMIQIRIGPSMAGEAFIFFGLSCD